MGHMKLSLLLIPQSPYLTSGQPHLAPILLSHLNTNFLFLNVLATVLAFQQQYEYHFLKNSVEAQKMYRHTKSALYSFGHNEPTF